MKNYDATESLKEMISSCYAYGGIKKDSYNYQRYILPYKEKMSEEVFNQIYNEEAERLNQYRIVHGVYTDCDGLTYNSLEKIK